MSVIASCFDKIEMRPAEYREVIERRYHFAIAPCHLDRRVERLVEKRDSHWVVEKIGEAREALDRQHPQHRHDTRRSEKE